MKFKDYKGGRVSGLLTLKIDGVRAHRSNGQWTSRKDKPLYNLPEMPDGVYEVYLGDWSKSVSACRTIEGTLIHPSSLYSLYPTIDPRLVIKEIHYDLPPEIPAGQEGYVIHSKDGYIKIKNKYTYDVKVTGIQAGTGKHLNKMGALITEMGKVGTGFTDVQRVELLDCVGSTIEVECMELTPDGKFRHPRFVRLRPDKD